jgi:CheY-like chemotaxis protein
MKILIADDEPLIRRSLQKVFEREGFEVLLAEDGLQALELWRSQALDGVILDVLMPGLTGPEVIAEMGPVSTPIILISAYTGDYNLEKAKSLGADLFIEKPFDSLQDIVHSLRNLIKGL